MVYVVDRAGACEHKSTYYFRCTKSEHLIELVTGCHSRFASQCPVCSAKWAGMNRKRFGEAIDRMDHPIFMTLTLTKKVTIDDNLNRIWQCRKALFKRLRREGYKIRSWIGVVEDGNHLHLVLDSNYIPQRNISKIWKAVTGDSYIVDIRAVKGSRGASAYISKYLTKGLGIDVDPALLKGFHVVQTNGVKALPKNKFVCPCCGAPVIKMEIEHFLAIERSQPPDRPIV